MVASKDARRKAGLFEVGRATLLAVTTVGMAAVTWIDSYVDPTPLR